MTETRAIKSAYGDHAYKVAISSPKSMIGHLVGAAGIASALAGLGAIRDQVLPPTINLRTPDPECDLDYVPLVKRAARQVADGWWLEAQNPGAGATDSSSFGPVPLGSIYARVLLRYWRHRTP